MSPQSNFVLFNRLLEWHSSLENNMHISRLTMPCFLSISLLFILTSMCSAFPAHSNNAPIALNSTQNSLSSRSLQSATSQFDHALSKRARIHTGFSADGWKVRFTATASLIPLQSAALTLEQFYESVIDKLPGMNFQGLDNPNAGAASLNIGGITLTFRSLPGKLTNDFILAVAQTLRKALFRGYLFLFETAFLSREVMCRSKITPFCYLIHAPHLSRYSNFHPRMGMLTPNCAS